MAQTPMTELEAVNLMLATIGEAPVDTLNTSGLVEVTIAQTKLNNISRNVQAQGWWFNRETEYPMTPDTNDEIPLATNVLEIDTSERSAHYDVVERNRKLYDKGNHTFKFTEKLYVDVTWFFPYDELPHAARWYIAVAAARRYQKAMVGSETLDAFTEEDEEEALAAMLAAETKSGDYNINRSPMNRAIVGRHFNPRGY